jgi:hypothetical protein
MGWLVPTDMGTAVQGVELASHVAKTFKNAMITRKVMDIQSQMWNSVEDDEVRRGLRRYHQP